MNLLFEGLGLSEELVLHLETLGFTEPTPIQVQAIPHLLAGRDVVGQAQTGTGKTAAFSLPILERIDLDVTAVQALVLTPTRELAMQVTEAIRDLSGISSDGPVKVGRSLQVLTVYGGQSIDRQMQRLKRGVHVVVGTPGRILDMLARQPKLDKVKWLVLDEADEMLSMGFIQDVEKILDAAPKERQTAFFSATMEASIRKLVSLHLRNPVNVTVEQPKATPKRISQGVYMIPRGWSKARRYSQSWRNGRSRICTDFVRTRAVGSRTHQPTASSRSQR